MNKEINKIISWIEMSYTRLNYKEELSLVDYIKQLQQENSRYERINQKYKEVIEKIKTRYCDYYGTTKEINDDYVLRSVLKEISDILKEVE